MQPAKIEHVWCVENLPSKKNHVRVPQLNAWFTGYNKSTVRKRAEERVIDLGEGRTYIQYPT